MQSNLESAQAFIDAGNYAEADRALSRALTLNPRNAEAYYLRGISQAESGKVTLAQADWERAIELYQSEGKASYVLNIRGRLEALSN